MKRIGYYPERKTGPLLDAFINGFHHTLGPQRLGMEAMATFMRLPKGASVKPSKVGGVPCEVISGMEDENQRTILYLHGGGYCTCSARTHRFIVAILCRAARARAIILDYRLAPEHPFPAALEDATAAYCHLLEQGVDPRCLALAGDSAGGGLCMALMLAIAKTKAPLPAAAYLMSPWMDLTPSRRPFYLFPQLREDFADRVADRMASLYTRDHNPSHPYISPLYGDFSGLPPLLVTAGKHEPLRKDAALLAQRAAQAGVNVTFEPYYGPVHVAQGLAGISTGAARLLGRGGRFIRNHCPGD